MPFCTTYTIFGGLSIIIKARLLIRSLPSFFETTHLTPKGGLSQLFVDTVVLRTQPKRKSRARFDAVWRVGAEVKDRNHICLNIHVDIHIPTVVASL